MLMRNMATNDAIIQTAHGFNRLSQFRGKLREQNVHDGHGFERAHYMNILGNAWQAHGMR